MSAVAHDLTVFDLIRDVRHLDARAAGDLADWLVHLDLEGKSSRTLYEYSRKVAPLLRAFPEKRLDEFTHTDINETLHRLPERSRYISRSIYNSWFTWATIDERLERNPMDKVAKMRQPKRRPKDIFSEEEIALLEASADGPLWALAFGAGLRRGEMRNLRRDHIDLARARLIVYHGKGDKDRIVPLRASVLAAVADLDLYERLERTDYLWYTLRGARKHRRTPMSDSTFDRWYRRGLADAGLTRYLNPHQTRHTFGWRLRAEGFDLEERALYMGHEDSRTTSRYYGHLTIEDLAEKVALLPTPARPPKPKRDAWVPELQPKPEVLSAAALERVLQQEAAARVTPKVAPEHTQSERSIERAIREAQETE